MSAEPTMTREPSGPGEFRLGEVWTAEDTMRWLNKAAAAWGGEEMRLRWPSAGVVRAVKPKHKMLKGGYGKWLRECPEWDGLFELIHRLVVNWDGGSRRPTPEELLRELQQIERERAGQLVLFAEVQANQNTEPGRRPGPQPNQGAASQRPYKTP